MDENGDPITLTEEQMREDPSEPTGNQPEVPETPPKPEEQEPEPVEKPEISNDPVTPPAAQKEEEQPEPPVSRRESKRIDQLLNKLQTREQEMLTKGAPASPAPKRQEPGNPIIPEGDYTTEELNQMVREYGDSILRDGLSEVQALNIASNFATRLEIDIPKISSKYEFLNTESDEFNPGPAEFINRLYLSTVGYNPTNGVVQDRDLRYSEFVEGFMDVVDLIANGKLADATASVASQAAQGGPRPSATANNPLYQGDDPRQMTDEQLDAAIAQGLGIGRK